MLQAELTSERLLSNPREAIACKKGNVLTPREEEVIAAAIVQIGIEKRGELVRGLVEQAVYLARVNCPGLIKLGREYFEARPAATDATGALAYIRLAVAAAQFDKYDTNLIDLQPILLIAGSLLAANQKDIAYQILHLASQPFLAWRRDDQGQLKLPSPSEV